jgi:hypothetical protein
MRKGNITEEAQNFLLSSYLGFRPSFPVSSDTDNGYLQ